MHSAVTVSYARTGKSSYFGLIFIYLLERLLQSRRWPRLLSRLPLHEFKPKGPPRSHLPQVVRQAATWPARPVHWSDLGSGLPRKPNTLNSGLSLWPTGPGEACDYDSLVLSFPRSCSCTNFGPGIMPPGVFRSVNGWNPVGVSPL